MKNFIVLIFMLVMVIACSTTKPISNSTKALEILDPVKVPTKNIILETVVVPSETALEFLGTVSTPTETIKVETVPGQDMSKGDFSVKSNLAVVKTLADIGNCLVLKHNFYADIEAHKQFDYTKDTSVEVATKLTDYIPVVLTTYYKPWPSKTIAYRNPGSNVIYLNTRFLQSKPTKDRLNTLWHERAHVRGYDHGDNYAKGKGNSVNYGTGKIAESYFDECYAALK